MKRVRLAEYGESLAAGTEFSQCLKEVPPMSVKTVASFALLAALGLGLLVCIPLHAQVASGTIQGTITDKSGAAVPNAQVTIKNNATGTIRTVTTDEAGFYDAPNLQPGKYKITASAPGFATLVENEITLTVGAEIVVNMQLRVGDVSEVVEVSGGTPQVDTATSALSATVQATTVRELPLNGRDWTSLANLQPGVASVRTQGVSGATSARGNRGFGDELTVNGHRPQENNYRIDGVSINDYSNGAPGSSGQINLGVDAVEEFSVLTSNYSAEYGRTSGGVINAITRSGTNSIHGSVYEFIRNSALDARDFFAPAPAQKPQLRRNQFGASLGAPIRKDKTFIFGDYEGIRLAQATASKVTVPTQAARQGNLSTGPVTVDPAVVPYLQFWPLPSGPATGDTAQVTIAPASVLREDFWTTRADHRFSAHDTLSGTYLFDDASFTVPDALNVAANGNITRRQMVALQESHTFSQALINTLRVGYNRTKGLVNVTAGAINPAASDLSLGAVPGRAAPQINVSGLTSFPGGVGGNSLFRHYQNSYQIYDDAFLTKHAHLLKFGFAFERIQYNLFAERRANGQFIFGTLANFLTNKPRSFFAIDPARSNPAGIRQSDIAGYFQDDWHIRSSFTFNLGVRYEVATKPTEAHNRLTAVQNLFGAAPLAVDSYFQNNPTLRNFEPRLGFAWDPFKNGKTAIRAGFGIYDALPLPYIFAPKAAQSAPFLVASTKSNLPAGAFPKTAFSLLVFNPNTTDNAFVEPNPHRNYLYNWNLTIQRTIVSDWSATVAYVGSRGIHNGFTMDDVNIVLPVALTLPYAWPTPRGSGTKVDPNAGVLRSGTWDGDSYYHALQVQGVKRMSHGFQLQSSYTWSKCIDTGSAISREDQFLNGISLFFFDKTLRRGLCDFNIYHSFVSNGIWNVPSPNLGAIGSAILGGWQLGTILTASSGVPFTVTIGGDPLGVNSSDPIAFPNRVAGPGCSNPVNPGSLNYLNVNCFALPTAPASFTGPCQSFPASPKTCTNVLGNSGRNSLVGPGLLDLDFSVYKNIPLGKISEAFRIQFRAEFFNILNHPNFKPPLDNNQIFNQSGNPNGKAGVLSAPQTASRQIQFGLKLNW